MRAAWIFWRWVGSLALTGWLAAGPAAAFEAPMWFDGARPGVQAWQAVELLANAGTHGLDPADYAATALQLALQHADSRPAPDAAATARLDAALTQATLRYLSDLHEGRVKPQQLQQSYSPVRREAFDAAAYLRDAVEQRRVGAALQEAAPQLPQYERLRAALALYRGLLTHPAWAEALPPLPPGPRGAAGKLEPGAVWAGLPRLAERLLALGDLQQPLPAPPVPAPLLYESALVEALKSFQQRHGLRADGIIGKTTLAQLQVLPAARVRQIELALERLRWTPVMQGPRMIVINIPEFELRAYAVHGGRIQVATQMKVIVGKALNQRTPLFDADMRFVEFSPYWNVPPSIVRGELLPRLRRDPAYLDREGFEFVGTDGRVHRSLSAQHLDALQAGELRIRQRPGPRNALGQVKFVFPNHSHIYLHHTPSVGLFERDRRDFSHGCIRVEAPLALARFVLQGLPEWTDERILAAMAKGESSTVRLAEPVRVLIAYGTALVKDGRIHFYEDIYRQDRALDNALRTPARRPPALD